MNQQIQITKGVITIKMDGLDERTIERYRQNIHQIICQGVFNLEEGQAILHFREKQLMEIEINFVKWRRKKDMNP